MTLRDNILPVLYRARLFVATLGFRRYDPVQIITRTWSGTEVGEGTATDVVVTITPKPRVEFVSNAEVVASGGTYRDGDMKLKFISPRHSSTLGHTPAQLRARTTGKNVEVFYKLTGDEGVLECTPVRVDTERGLRYEVVVRNTRKTP